MARRRNIDIRRSILKTLEIHGWMTLSGIAGESGTTLRTAKRHLYHLERFKGKIEMLSYYPKGRLYRLRRARVKNTEKKN